MSEEQSKPLAAFLALLPIGLLLIIECFAESLQTAEKLIPHLAFGVLIAQLLCLVAFIKGEICPGQRGRLIKANVCFALYWFVWLGMNLASPHHYVMTDIVSLCGGKETQHSNQILVEVVQNALEQAGLPRHAVQAITDPNRELVMQLLKLDRYVDMIIPRGGAGLHELCKQHSTIPVIVGGVGVCHLFVEESADQEKALAVIANAKCQRPSTCNTLETLLVQRSIAETFLPKLAKYLAEKKVKFHAKSTALSILQAANVNVQEVTEQALRQEWGSLDLNVVVVEDMDAAIAHIREYGTQHSESILTENQRLATQFINQVDAAAVYVNASTRFTDGGQFGLGAEVAVSTQKLHARGPMGLEALTSYKWVCVGDYTSRK
jgi:glutamate-5-semialdehyde dehydrogenase